MKARVLNRNKGITLWFCEEFNKISNKNIGTELEYKSICK